MQNKTNDRPYFIEFNPSRCKKTKSFQPTTLKPPVIQQHYWEKTPVASLVIDTQTVLQIQPTRER